MKKISSYYIESREFYVRGFADHLISEGCSAYTTTELNALFKWYLDYYKNIKADLRSSFWKGVRNNALKLAKYEKGGEYFYEEI